MATTKVYNKNTLREHPDLNPVLSPGFEKGHSFIFPGDEIVMCTKLDLPNDIGGSWVGKTLSYAKMSIIAKKPNIFTEEFDTEFQSTREFELDSFQLNFNNSNAPMVPWGTDGYAPNVNFQQDRVWALPSGDFRRQINVFTTHVNGTQSWKYNFWYPIIFREDYWNALAAADQDFYNNLLPQNGKNEKWLRYHDLSLPPFGWKIFYKFELFYTDNLSQSSIVSELPLSNEQTGIQDYQINPDYALLEIKTCPVGGTPSNNPSCFIFGSQNTSCFAYFTKQTAWDDPSEKTNISAVFRIRPFEGGDFLGSRGSSLYPADNNVVWAANSNYLATDAGDKITTDFGDRILLGGGSIPITVSFDSMDDKKIIVQGEIDYQKLNAIFPGVNKFTLYCRLYNSTIITTPTPPPSTLRLLPDAVTEHLWPDGTPANF